MGVLDLIRGTTNRSARAPNPEGLATSGRDSMLRRRGRDLNPRRTFQHVRDFQSRSFGRSDTSPRQVSAYLGHAGSPEKRSARRDCRIRRAPQCRRVEGETGTPMMPRREQRAVTRTGGPDCAEVVAGTCCTMRLPRRSGRVAEGGALLRRYGGECLHRGFESLLLRLASLTVGALRPAPPPSAATL